MRMLARCLLLLVILSHASCTKNTLRKRIADIQRQSDASKTPKTSSAASPSSSVASGATSSATSGTSPLSSWLQDLHRQGVLSTQQLQQVGVGNATQGGAGYMAPAPLEAPRNLHLPFLHPFMSLILKRVRLRPSPPLATHPRACFETSLRWGQVVLMGITC